MSNVLEIILNLVDNLTSGMSSPVASVQELADTANTADEALDSIDTNALSDVAVDAQGAATDLTGVSSSAKDADTAITNIDASPLSYVMTNADGVTYSFEAAGTAATDAGADIASIDSGPLSSVGTEAAGVADGLKGVGTEAGAAGAGVANIDAGALNEAAAHASALGSSLVEVAGDAKTASGGIGDVANSASDLDAVVAGITSLGLAAWFDTAINAAGNFGDSWERVGDAMGQGALSAEQVQSAWSGAMNTMKSSTGRGAGVIRNYLIQMGLAGVTNAETLESAFTGISGAAFVTGNDIGTIEGAFARVVRTGTFSARQLTTLGLTTQDVYNATGLSVEDVSAKLAGMSTDARAAYLAQIVNAKYGTDANEDYKKSWQHVKDELGLAYEYLSRIIGGLLLPIVIPAINVATDALSGLASWVDNSNGVVKDILGVLVGGIGTLIMVAGAIKMIQTVASALSLVSLLANPVVLVIIAIVALVVAIYEIGKALGWWNNVSEMAAAFSARLTEAWNYLVGVCQNVYLALLSVYNWMVYVNAAIGNFVATITGAIMGALAWLAALPGTIWNYLMAIITYVATWALSLYVQAVSAGSRFVNGIISFVSQLPGTIWNYLMAIITYVATWALSLYVQAVSAGSRFVNGFIGLITSLPGKVGQVLMNVINRVTSFGGEAYNAAVTMASNIWEGFKAGLGIHSPSYLEKAMTAIIEKAQTMPDEFRSVSNDLANVDWQQGNPDVTVGATAKDMVNTASANSHSTVDVNQTWDGKLTLDLKNVPDNVDEKSLTSTLKSVITDNKVIKQLVKSDTFQTTLNSEVAKGTIRTKRARG